MDQQSETFRINNTTLEVDLPVKIDFAIANFFSKILGVRRKANIEVCILNFNSTRFATLPGALYLLAFCVLFSSGLHRKIIIQFQNIDLQIEKYLMSLGIFSKLSNRSGLFIGDKIIAAEMQLLAKRNFNEKSIILPISSIVFNPDKSYFEGYTKSFLDNFNYFFSVLSKYSTYNFSPNPDEFQEMFGAAYEIIKNIFDHSETEGWGAIHASYYNKGTTIAFFDTGIGIVKSIKKSKPTSFSSDLEYILWALGDGNSSKSNGINQGHGFTIMKDFCDSRNGIMTLRTESNLSTYKERKWTHRTVTPFPGTQLVIYNPIKNQ